VPLYEALLLADGDPPASPCLLVQETRGRKSVHLGANAELCQNPGFRHNRRAERWLGTVRHLASSGVEILLLSCHQVGGGLQSKRHGGDHLVAGKMADSHIRMDTLGMMQQPGSELGPEPYDN
jgi:hypothetical protein